MLAELLTWLATPAPWPARRLGYVAESVAIAARHRRCRNAWAPHLSRCREQIVAAAELAARDDKVAVVLGAGLVLDVPVTELLQRFSEVWLVDLVHLPGTWRLARAQPRLRLLNLDVTGLLGRLGRLGGGAGVGEWLGAMTPPPPPLPEVDRVGLVVSGNLWSQLPLRPLALAAARCRGWQDSDTRAAQRIILRQHLVWLNSLPGVRCLIADQAWETRNEAGGVVAEGNFNDLLPLHRCCAQWLWDIAPPGELAGGVSRQHQVVCCRW